MQLINAYRVRGHMEAEIDPLGRREKIVHPELTLDYYGLTPADLDRVVPTAPLRGIAKTATLRQIVAHCRAVYCQSSGQGQVKDQSIIINNYRNAQIKNKNKQILSMTVQSGIETRQALTGSSLMQIGGKSSCCIFLASISIHW